MTTTDAHTLILAAREDAILYAVYRYHFLTAAMVMHLLYSRGSLAYVRVLLKRLTQAGYLQRLRLPNVTVGNTPWVYTLARRGITYLAAAGYTDFARFRPSEQQEHSYLFLSHTLAVNDVLIAAARLPRTAPDVVLADFQHERALRQTPVMVTTAQGERIGIVPDGWLDFHLGGVARMCVLLELDRGTIEQRAFKRKLRGLVAYAAGPYQTVFGTTSLTVAIATTAGEQRAARLRVWCEQVLRELHEEQNADLFLITSLPPATGTTTGGELDPTHLFLAPVWSQPLRQTAVPLLELSACAT